MKFLLQLTALLTLSLFLTTSISAQELTLFPGSTGFEYYQDNEELSKEEFLSLIDEYPELTGKWQKARKKTKTGYYLFAGQTAIAIFSIDRFAREGFQDYSGGLLLGALVMSSFTSRLFAQSAKLKKEVILAYNQNLEQKTSLEIGTTKSGMGMMLKF